VALHIGTKNKKGVKMIRSSAVDILHLQLLWSAKVNLTQAGMMTEGIETHEMVDCHTSLWRSLVGAASDDQKEVSVVGRCDGAESPSLGHSTLRRGLGVVAVVTEECGKVVDGVCSVGISSSEGGVRGLSLNKPDAAQVGPTIRVEAKQRE
jgi:hypothetical protein